MVITRGRPSIRHHGFVVAGDRVVEIDAIADPPRVASSLPAPCAVNDLMVWTLLSLGESRPFYGRWIRRSIAQINETMPQRKKSERVQAARALPPTDYTRLITCAGFQILEIRERRVLLSQAAVRAISSYRDFAMGALRAVDEDADAASQALQASVQPTFRDLRMKYLPRKWLEIIAVKV